jgi:DNA polymerase
MTLSAFHSLAFLLDSGVDEILAETPQNRFLSKAAEEPFAFEKTQAQAPPLSPATAITVFSHTPPPIETTIPLGTFEAVMAAEKAAKAATTLDALKDALVSFDGIHLKRSAKHLVFEDGNRQAPIMIIGEAPGADEDRVGKAFVGVSGQLLDKMFQAIGYDRHQSENEKSLYLTNMIYWRPAGNRTPSDSEIEILKPFIEKQIDLVKPRLLVLLGNIATKTLLKETAGITRLRGRWFDYQTLSNTTIRTMPLLHPSYLLKTPSHKKETWQDLLKIKSFMTTTE